MPSTSRAVEGSVPIPTLPDESMRTDSVSPVSILNSSPIAPIKTAVSDEVVLSCRLIYPPASDDSKLATTSVVPPLTSKALTGVVVPMPNLSAEASHLNLAVESLVSL